MSEILLPKNAIFMVKINRRMLPLYFDFLLFQEFHYY